MEFSYGDGFTYVPCPCSAGQKDGWCGEGTLKRNGEIVAELVTQKEARIVQSFLQELDAHAH